MAIDFDAKPTPPDEQLEEPLGAVAVAVRAVDLWIKRPHVYAALLGSMLLLSGVLRFTVLVLLFGDKVLATFTSDLQYLSFSLDLLPGAMMSWMNMPVTFVIADIALVAIGLFLSGLGTAWVIAYVLSRYGRGVDNLHLAISRGNETFAGVVSVSVVVSLVTGGLLVVWLLAMSTSIYLVLTASAPSSYILLLFAGGMLCLFAALFFAVRMYVAMVVPVADDCSVSEALRRSYVLTQGRFFHVLGAIIMFTLLKLILAGIVLVGLTAIFVTAGQVALLVASLGVAFLVAPIDAVFRSVLYLNLLKMRSGVGPALGVVSGVEPSGPVADEWW